MIDAMRRAYRRFLLPVGILSGAIIGAGVFSLPYVLHPFGTVVAGLYLGLLGLVFATVHLLYADLLLRTPGSPNFVGVARYYLGTPGLWLTFVTGVLQTFLVLLVYLVLAQSFVSLVVPSAAPASGVFAFWFFGSLAIFLSVRRFAAVEFFITGGIVAIFGFVFWLGLSSAAPLITYGGAPLPLGVALLAIGPVLFSLSGRVAVAEIITYFRRDVAATSDIRRSVVAGTLLPAFCYFLFVVAVWALSPVVSADAVSGLRGVVSSGTLVVIGILGLLSLWSSYIIVGLNVKNILRDDLRFPAWVAGAFVVVLPPALYAFGFTNFLALIGFIGSTFLAVEGALIIYLWQRANRENAPVLLLRLSWCALLPLYIIFALALVSVFM
ncbi:MAG: aromatic amino acid transport family protein [bacterium]|nr:aromatic amino acid transport family protein [bacterium]